MYFITCMEKPGTELKNGKPDFGAIRTFGYKETYEVAEEALNDNWCDMFEYYYYYAVIEEINPGKINKNIDEKHRTWFQYNEEKEGFFQIEKPNNNQIETLAFH